MARMRLISFLLSTSGTSPVPSNGRSRHKIMPSAGSPRSRNLKRCHRRFRVQVADAAFRPNTAWEQYFTSSGVAVFPVDRPSQGRKSLTRTQVAALGTQAEMRPEHIGNHRAHEGVFRWCGSAESSRIVLCYRGKNHLGPTAHTPTSQNGTKSRFKHNHRPQAPYREADLVPWPKLHSLV